LIGAGAATWRVRLTAGFFAADLTAGLAVVVFFEVVAMILLLDNPASLLERLYHPVKPGGPSVA
jgi:hypothetical protein